MGTYTKVVVACLLGDSVIHESELESGHQIYKERYVRTGETEDVY